MKELIKKTVREELGRKSIDPPHAEVADSDDDLVGGAFRGSPIRSHSRSRESTGHIGQNGAPRTSAGGIGVYQGATSTPATPTAAASPLLSRSPSPDTGGPTVLGFVTTSHFNPGEHALHVHAHVSSFALGVEQCTATLT